MLQLDKVSGVCIAWRCTAPFVSCFKSVTLLLFFIHTSIGHDGGTGLHLAWDVCLSSNIIIIPPEPLDGSKYQWKQSQDEPALAVENLWPLRPKKVQGMFLGVELLLFEPIDAARISSAAREAWKVLRSGIPRSP